jgi:predicted AlkP superfamily phosphohydrolase/phosphomutase
MRCLFIGLDSFDPDILRHGAARGEFPALARLLARGRAVETTTDPGSYVGSLWPTVTTGVDPTRHGIYSWAQFEPDTYHQPRCDEREIMAPAFWMRLSQAGHRVAIIDVPIGKLDPVTNGVHVLNWLSHFKTIEGFVTAPAGLAKEIEARYGLDPVPSCDAIDRSPDGIERFTKALISKTKQRTEFALELIADGSYDFMTLAYSECHCVGHQCYHLHSKDGAGDDPVSRVYRAIDQAVGRIVDACPEGCEIILLASHGIGPQSDGNHLAERLVRRVDRKVKGVTPIPFARRLLDLVEGNRVRRYLGPIARLLPTELPRRAHARAFAVINSNAALGVRVNLAGREQAGLVAKADYDRYLDALQDMLMSARHSGDGTPAFTEAVRTARVYGADPQHIKLPDLMLTWDHSRPFTSLEVPGVARISGQPHGARTGDHRDGGLAVFVGPSGHNTGFPERIGSEAIAHHILAMFDHRIEVTQTYENRRPVS